MLRRLLLCLAAFTLALLLASPALAASYTVRSSVYLGTGGTATPSVQTVGSGGSASVTLTPASGYGISRVTDNGLVVTGKVVGNTYTLYSVRANHSIVATYQRLVSYTVSAQVFGGVGGIASPTSQRVVRGGTASVRFIPAAGYRMRRVTDRGLDVTSRVSDGVYTMTNVVAPLSILVYYEKLPAYPVTAYVSGGAYGSVTPKTQSVLRGGTASITITPNAGYRLSRLTDNGLDVTSQVTGGVYTLAGITTAHTLAATFQKIATFTVTAYVSRGGGWVSPASQTVVQGEGASVSVTPFQGFRVAQVLDNGRVVTAELADGAYRLRAVGENHSVVAVFEPHVPELVVGQYVMAGGLLGVSYGDQPFRVRLAGLDIPPLGEPFAKDANEALYELVVGKTLVLETDGQKQDEQGHLIVYAWQAEGDEMLNVSMLRRGLARIKASAQGLARLEQLREAEAEGQSRQMGIWGGANRWLDVSIHSPVALGGGAYVYDSQRDQLIYFGSETAIYDLSTRVWRRPLPAMSPQRTYPPSLVYDERQGKVIMFGGILNSPEVVDPTLDHTWVYDPGANIWTKQQPTGPMPPSRYAHNLVYEPESGKVIMFGGYTGDNLAGYFPLNDTWAYDPAANAWTELSPSNPPRARGYASMVFDKASGRVVLFGGESDGQHLGDTWTYDPTANIWTEVVPPGALGAPPARSSAAMVYDAARGSAVVFGGWDETAVFGDTWAFDEATKTWAELAPSGTLPAPRYGALAAYDSLRSRFYVSRGSNILFTEYSGGRGQPFYDTWVLTAP